MKQIVRLDQIAHIPTPSTLYARPEHMEEARRALVDKMHLSFDNATGTTSNFRGRISYVTNPSEWTPLEDETAVMRLAFLRHIIIAAHRIRRGVRPFDHH